jgi:hypothetical protein
MPRFEVIQTATWVVDADTLADLEARIARGTENALGEPDELEEKIRPVPMWFCRGCGAGYQDGDADLIVAYVEGCDLVDGAGNPVAGRSPR